MGPSIPPPRAERYLKQIDVSVLTKIREICCGAKNSLDEMVFRDQIPRRSGPIRKKEQKWE
jgi:hypothetical protein